MKKTIFLGFFFFVMFACFAEEPDDSSSAFDFEISADLVSRYIWRGIPLNLSPNLQPDASLVYKNFTLGAWGSYSVIQPYAEIDLYLSCTLGAFTIALNDYYNEDENDLSVNDYFKWSGSETGTPHALEGALSFDGTEKIPFSLTAATFFFGNDKDSLNQNYFSTYLELGYSFNIGRYELSAMLGGTTGEGFYAEKAALVNFGISAIREIKISDSFSVPVTASFILNPYARDVFFVFGITL